MVRNGVADGLQRYLCRSCSKTFNATTGTPLSRLGDKEQFEAYADCVRQGLSVRAAAAKVGVAVDKVLAKLNGAEVTAALKDAVKPGETVVCTGGHSAFLRLDKSLGGVEIRYFVAGYHGHTNKTFHVAPMLQRGWSGPTTCQPQR